MGSKLVSPAEYVCRHQPAYPCVVPGRICRLGCQSCHLSLTLWVLMGVQWMDPAEPASAGPSTKSHADLHQVRGGIPSEPLQSTFTRLNGGQIGRKGQDKKLGPIFGRSRLLQAKPSLSLFQALGDCGSV